MVIHLHVKKENLEDGKESTLHFMPCKIDCDDTANVSSYFTPYIRKISDEHFSCSFRGHALDGKKITVPSGYKGLTFYEYKKPESKDMDRNIYSTGKFSEFTYWNYDKLPSKNDAVISALDWIDIAEALHSTIDSEEK